MRTCRPDRWGTLAVLERGCGGTAAPSGACVTSAPGELWAWTPGATCGNPTRIRTDSSDSDARRASRTAGGGKRHPTLAVQEPQATWGTGVAYQMISASVN